MLKINIKKYRYYYLAVALLVLLAAARFIPVDSYTYATSGCKGLGTTVHPTVDYRIIAGQRSDFDSDRQQIPQRSFEFTQALCAMDTKTHRLYLL